ncbi:MAG: hypothetical protein Edafosvirus23_9 [Edafosvirus sp.]|uniref:Uncharacterized protein n=1 Tax=Edafosvirus sp. TaxID=2487765 RepID=A0A3G4ZUX8_9VIRU|nr:MAG: hypothetical protein Edafosvirus23_9 [Edafosvirus sp.]
MAFEKKIVVKLATVEYLTSTLLPPIEALNKLHTEYGVRYTISNDQQLVILNYPIIPIIANTIFIRTLRIY